METLLAAEVQERSVALRRSKPCTEWTTLNGDVKASTSGARSAQARLVVVTKKILKGAKRNKLNMMNPTREATCSTIRAVAGATHMPFGQSKGAHLHWTWHQLVGVVCLAGGSCLAAVVIIKSQVSRLVQQSHSLEWGLLGGDGVLTTIMGSTVKCEIANDTLFRGLRAPPRRRRWGGLQLRAPEQWKGVELEFEKMPTPTPPGVHWKGGLTRVVF
ncbi:hypothetical protein HaLaN_22133 [Haematococcus lacustris]|uniref:Uncharacterized protein n=1 Tax=Haematococcus lacustris TaxID=44745 RepID=A0A699ZZR3_HAELA|nr:hypothetical protein HaLaN_22133 [Haematococcus lacustris]